MERNESKGENLLFRQDDLNKCVLQTLRRRLLRDLVGIERINKHESLNINNVCEDLMFSGINEHLINLDNGGYRIIYDRKFVTLK